MLNGIENVKIMKTVCEKVVYEGLLVSLMFLKVKFFLSLFYLFQCEKTGGLFPQLYLLTKDV